MLHDPDHLGHVVRLARRPELKLLADRALPRPRLPCEGLVDDDHRRLVDGVLPGERPAREEPGVHRAEVIRRDRPAVGRNALPVPRGRLVERVRRERAAPRQRELRDDSDPPHARHRGELPLELAHERPPARRRRIAAGRHGEPERQHVARVEAGAHLLQGEEAPHQQARADEEDHRQGDLAEDQGVPHPVSGRAGSRPTASLQRAVRILARGLERGREPERQRRHQAGEGGERQHPAVDVDLAQPREVGRMQCAKQSQGSGRDHEAERATGHREQAALGEQLPDHRPSARAQRRPEGELAFPDRGPHQEQMGDVGAGDHQHEAHRAEQDHQRRPGMLDHVLLQRARPGCAPACPRARETPCGTGGRCRRARPEPGRT